MYQVRNITIYIHSYQHLYIYICRGIYKYMLYMCGIYIVVSIFFCQVCHRVPSLGLRRGSKISGCVGGDIAMIRESTDIHDHRPLLHNV